MPLSRERIHAELADLVMWLCGPEAGSSRLLTLRVMADESHDDRKQKVMAFAGLIAPSQLLGDFWYEWHHVLKRPEFGVDVFHASDCETAQNAFHGWERERIIALQRALIGLMTDSQFGLVGFAVAFPIAPHTALRPEIREYMYLHGGSVNGPLDDPWFLGFQSLVAIITNQQAPIHVPEGEKIGFIFDRHCLSERGKTIYQVMADDSKWGERLGGVAFLDRAKMVPLQAADLFAYETFRYRLDTEIERQPERWQHEQLREIIAGSHWLDEAGMETVVRGGYNDFLKAVPNPTTPPQTTRRVKEPYSPTAEQLAVAERKRAERRKKREGGQ